MRIRNAAVAVIAGLLASPAFSDVRSIDIEIGVAPPPDRVIVTPEPRVGYIYERPHYSWDGNRYVWTEGRFIEERRGHVYVQPRVERRGEHWVFHRGHWDDD